MNSKQQKFVYEYLVDLNGTQAAIRAGYPAKTAHVQGSRLLRNAKVADAIALAQQARSARTFITPDRTLQELAILGFSDLTDFVEWDGKTVTLKNSADLDTVKRRAIAEISQTKDGVRIKLHDKKGALDSIARHLGMFNDKTTVGLDASLTELLSLMSGGNHVLNRVKIDDAG